MSQWTMYLVLSGVVLGLLGGVGYRLYDYGYNAGASAIQTELVAQRQEWESRIAASQLEVDNLSRSIELNYVPEQKRLKAQISSLKKNPKVVTKYVPVETKITEGVRIWHDRAVRGENLSLMIDGDALKESPYTMQDLCSLIAINYNNCNECMLKLKSLQTIVKTYIAEQEALKKKKETPAQ